MFRHTSLALLLLTLIGASSLAQTTLHVPAQYKTIQAGIDAAKNRDTVLVAPGLYAEAIDFKGKAITVRGSHGPGATVIEARGRPAVSFVNGETRDSVLEGFTLRRSSRGIYSTASPTVRDNVITENTIAGSNLAGGGVWCTSRGVPAVFLNNVIASNSISVMGIVATGGSGGGVFADNVVLMGNRITGNRIVGSEPTMMGYLLTGAGVYCIRCLVVNNLVNGNYAHVSHFNSTNSAIGGGIFSDDSRLINNTVVGNALVGTHSQSFRGAGIGGSAQIFANTIVRGNSIPQYPQSQQVSMTVASEHCNIQGGHSGLGNIDADPRFTSDGTWHLRPDSPCRDAGSKDYLNFSASDFEWDDRGWGGGVDIGADEFASHVYHHGQPQRGETFTLAVTGPPGKTVWLGYAARLLTEPATIPGSGRLWLDPWTLQLMPLGQLPSNGQTELKLSIPKNAPLVSVPFQALVGVELTPPEVIRIIP